jgi:hypothetical protein
VNIDDEQETARRIVKEKGYRLRVLYDDADVADAYGVTNVPTTLFIDRQGTVRYRIVGFSRHGDSRERINWCIEQLAER